MPRTDTGRPSAFTQTEAQTILRIILPIVPLTIASVPPHFKVSFDNASASNNSTAINVMVTSNVPLERPVVTGNGSGMKNTASPNMFYTFMNHLILGNGANSLNTMQSLQ